MGGTNEKVHLILHAGPNAAERAGLGLCRPAPPGPEVALSLGRSSELCLAALAEDGTTVNQSRSMTETTYFEGIVNTSGDNGRHPMAGVSRRAINNRRAPTEEEHP